MKQLENSKEKERVSHGGARKGAGRKKGGGAFGEETKVVRIPVSKVVQVKTWLLAEAELKKQREQLDELQNLAGDNARVYVPSLEDVDFSVPLYGHKVVAGFPSPADDYVEDRLNLNDRLIHNKEATFLLRVQGDSMKKVGIFDGDLLVVDRSIAPTDGRIVIASLDGQLTVKRLSIKSTGTWLVPENDHFPPIPVKEESDIVIWGIVTSTIREF